MQDDIRKTNDDGDVLVSVVVPLYNKEEHLPQLFDSVLSQDVSSLELLFVDDCSTDGSVALVQRRASEDPRVRLVRHEHNQGPGAARNTGLAESRGRFVAFLDADDWYNDETYLRRLCEGALANGVLAAGATLCNVYSQSFMEWKYPDMPMWSDYAFTESGVVAYEDYQFEYGSPRFVYARELFDAQPGDGIDDGPIAYDDRRFFEDPPVMARLLYRAGSFYGDAHAQYMYRLEYRRDAWNTRKACDLIEGARLNLAFSRRHGLAHLHWITVNHFEWESSDISIGIRGDIDVETVHEALMRFEAEVDHGLLVQEDEHWYDYVPLLRARVDEVRLHGKRSLRTRIIYRFLHTRLWYAIRIARDKRRYRARFN